MFEQAVDVVLKGLRVRLSVGAKPRASGQAISRLISAKASDRVIPLSSSSSSRIGESDDYFERLEVSAEAPVPQMTACIHCAPSGRFAGGNSRLLLPRSLSSGDVLLVGECVCSVKDAEIASFGGASGELLLKMLKTMGLGRDAVNMVNVITCESVSGRCTLESTESLRAESRETLREVVRKQPVRLIIAMGANAAAALFDAEPQIEALRSTWRAFEGVPVMTTFHAAHLIQNPAISERRKVWEDLMQVMEKLGMEVSERQRGFFLK